MRQKYLFDTFNFPEKFEENKNISHCIYHVDFEKREPHIRIGRTFSKSETTEIFPLFKILTVFFITRYLKLDKVKTFVSIELLDPINSNIAWNSDLDARFFYEITIYFKDVKNMIRYFSVPKIRISRHFRAVQVRESRFPQVKIQNVTRCKFRISLCWERCAGSECTANSRILAWE